MYTVYKHTTPSGKVYIGITSREVEKRWNNGYGYQQNKHFYSAIQKYGWENIKHDILFEKLTQQQAFEKEIEMIRLYKSNDRRFGYNKSTGGESTVKGARWKLSKECVEKRAQKLRGRKLTEEHKKKLSEAHKGLPSYKREHPMSEETKIKISNSLKKWNAEHESPNKGKKRKKSPLGVLRTIQGHYKPIVCVETGIVYDSIKHASIKNNIDNSSLSKVCRKLRETAGGYHWRFLNED